MPIASKNINAEKIQGNLSITSISASAFTGSFIGDGAALYNLPTQSIDTGSLVSTASFNAFTASYATGSFTGSFTGSLDGTASFAVTASYSQTGGNQNLQSVTDNGTTTGNGMQIIGATFQVTNGIDEFSEMTQQSYHIENTTNLTYADLKSNGTLDLKSGIAKSSLKNTNVTNSNVILEFPNKTAGSYTIATTDDLNSYTTTSSFNNFTSSYATGSFTGSFTGSLQGTASYALTASYLDTYIPPFPYTGSAEITGSLTVTGSTNLYNPGATVLSVAGAQGEIFSVTDDTSGDLLVVQSGSTDILVVSASGQTTLSGSLAVTTGVTASLYGTASWAENAVTASYVLNAVSSSFAQTASYVLNAVSSSFALTSSFITASDVYGPYGSNSVISASYALQALSSSYANFATSASHTLFAETASNSLNAQDILIYVLNNSGYNIPKGTVVHITASGNSSNTPRIISASYENDANSANTVGIANESIANGANGYVMTEGVLRGIDTSNFISGQLIYLGATGSIIGSAPQAPLHGVRLGQVIRQQSNNGSIYVRIDNGYELDELHDVRIITASLQYGDLLMRSGSVWTNSKQLSGSYNMAGTLSATHVTASDLYAGNTYISGSLTVLGGATIFGSSSFVYITASQIDVSASFISVNVFEPIQRFGGLKVYDSGSSSATASLAWDSLHNHWVYQNVSGSSYAGGMLLSGPRNTGSLGDEPELTQWFVPRSDGGDHLENSQIYSSGSIHQVTGSLTVTGGITGSLSGTASWANNATSASFAQTASYAAAALTASYLIGGVTIDTGSLVTTASFNAYTGSNVSQFAGTASFATATTLLIRRSDYTGSADPNINLLYLGEAENGSAESATVWTISQLSISSSGATVTRTTSSAAWTNRYSYTYL